MSHSRRAVAGASESRISQNADWPGARRALGPVIDSRFHEQLSRALARKVATAIALPRLAFESASAHACAPRGDSQWLAHLDPRAVPLPHGTKVSTRVDRLAGERRVPQGAVGRVVGIVDEEVDVAIVGVVRYARDELLPRKLAQIRFAQHRAAAWAALRPCVVLEAVVGSRARGLADESSDIDRRGSYPLARAWSTALTPPPLDLVSVDGSEMGCGAAEGGGNQSEASASFRDMGDPPDGTNEQSADVPPCTPRSGFGPNGAVTPREVVR